MEERLFAIELLILLIAILELVLLDELLPGFELFMLLAATLELVLTDERLLILELLILLAAILDLARLLAGLPILLLVVLIRLLFELCKLLLLNGILEMALLLRSNCILAEELLALSEARLLEPGCDLADELETTAVADDDSDALLPGRLSVAIPGTAVVAPDPPPQALNSSENSTRIHPLDLGYACVIRLFLKTLLLSVRQLISPAALNS